MKEIRYIFFLILTISVSNFFTSCLHEEFDPLEWAIDPELEFASQTLTFGPFAEKQIMHIQCNYNECTVNSSAEWCHTRVNLDSLAIYVEVDSNHEGNYRTAEIIVTLSKGNKQLSKTFNVIQNAGKWEMIGEWKVFWDQDVNDYQKGILSEMIQNLVKIPKGSFLMGGQGIDSLAANYFPFLYDSSEVHRVTLTKDYYINRYEVSQKEWNAIMDNNPSRFIGENLPVENITWESAVLFIEKISKMTGLNFRLPSSAQWEYAAQGGKNTNHYFYAGSNNYNDVGKTIYDETDPLFSTDEVGSYTPNELGLYNMSGNVSELCVDWYDYYSGENETDPSGPSSGSFHVTRGGSFNAPPSIMCSVYSRWALLSDSFTFDGLRISITP